jgi:hypothetical protein
MDARFWGGIHFPLFRRCLPGLLLQENRQNRGRPSIDEAFFIVLSIEHRDAIPERVMLIPCFVPESASAKKLSVVTYLAPTSGGGSAPPVWHVFPYFLLFLLQFIQQLLCWCIPLLCG